jgi:Carbohydrate-selective porin
MNKALCITLLCLVAFLWGIAECQAQEEKLEFNASYTGDYLYNMTGGIKTGGMFMSYAKLGMNFGTEPIGLWKGGNFCIGGGYSTGSSASEKLIGDFQVADNIEAGTHSFLEYLWYEQHFESVFVRFGLQDLNENFAVCGPAGKYINSSFGIHPVMSSNICAPIFPITGLGAEIHWRINPKWHVQAAVYDGNLTDFDENPHNTNWSFNRNEGCLIISEVQYSLVNGSYRLGAFYHTGENKSGVYTSVEQNIWQNEQHRVSGFIQSSLTLKEKHNNNYFHLGGGVNMSGVFSKQGNDAMGIAFSTVFLDDKHNSETVLEWFYKYKAANHLTIQPDLQYIINPSGTEDILPNAFVGIIRIAVEL